MSYARSPRLVCSTTIGTRLSALVWLLMSKSSADGFLERHCLLGVPGALGDPVDHLLFHRTRLQRSEEHTSELQSLMRISYAVFCLKTKKKDKHEIKSNIGRTAVEIKLKSQRK